MEAKKVIPPDDQKIILYPVTLNLFVDYRIMGCPEKELRKLFHTIRGENGSNALIITGYKENPVYNRTVILPGNPDQRNGQ